MKRRAKGHQGTTWVLGAQHGPFPPARPDAGASSCQSWPLTQQSKVKGRTKAS